MAPNPEESTEKFKATVFAVAEVDAAELDTDMSPRELRDTFVEKSVVVGNGQQATAGETELYERYCDEFGDSNE